MSVEWKWITGLTAHCLPQGRDCGSMTESVTYALTLHYNEMLW